jgi:hypothetical protein
LYPCLSEPVLSAVGRALRVEYSGVERVPPRAKVLI